MLKSNIYLLLALMLFSLAFVSAECSDYGTYKQSSSINLIQTCTACQGVNASIVYPDGTQTGSFAFQNINNVYNYTFTNTTQLGTYNVIGLDAWCYSFEVTSSGANQTTAQGLGSISFILLLFGLMIIFGFIGWKLLNNDLLWAGGVLFIGLALLILIYNVWLVYEFKLNYTGSTPDALIPQVLFIIFLTILTAGLMTAFVLLITKWKVVKEKFKNAIKPEEEDKDELY